MDRKLRRFHKRKENGGRPVEKKQRLRMMRTELSIEEQIMLAASNKLYSNRNPDKGIRIVTVICYFFSISLAAILLSVYYVYFWHPEYKNTTVIRNTNCDLAKEISARTINATEVFYNKLLKTLQNTENAGTAIGSNNNTKKFNNFSNPHELLLSEKLQQIEEIESITSSTSSTENPVELAIEAFEEEQEEELGDGG